MPYLTKKANYDEKIKCLSLHIKKKLEIYFTLSYVI